MDHLQNDIDSLESERGALREKLKSYNTKKGDLKSTTAFDITASSPYIAQELNLLKKAFNDERSERLRLQALEYRKLLDNLEPIHVPQQKDNRMEKLESEIFKIKNDYVMSLVHGVAIPSSKQKSMNFHKILKDHKLKLNLERQQIKSRASTLASEILEEYLQRNPHRSVAGDFSKFPTVELKKAFD